MSSIIYIAKEPVRVRQVPGLLRHTSAMKRHFSFQMTRSPGLLHLSRVASPPPAWPCTPRHSQTSPFHVLLWHPTWALQEELSWRAATRFGSLSLRRCQSVSFS